jgi:hypothetical protein
MPSQVLMTDVQPSVARERAAVPFRRVHKSALGVAFGIIVGGALFAITAFHVALNVRGLPLGLLSNYFQGYDVTWPGAFIGLAWGLTIGFVAGWLLGFVHNFTVGLWILLVVAREDLRRTGNFLDHI